MFFIYLVNLGFLEVWVVYFHIVIRIIGKKISISL